MLGALSESGPPIFRASVMYAALVGSAGFVLSLLAWHLFRGSPFGRSLVLLAAFMLALAVYHPLLLLYPGHAPSVLLLESLAFALVAAFGILTVRQHYRLSRRGGGV